MKSRSNQRTKIWKYLCCHPEGITPYEAFLHLKITKLSTRIGEMIREGYEIRKSMEYKVTDDGSRERYMRYWKSGERAGAANA